MTSLSTEWSRSMGLTAPIVNAPMGGAAGGALAAAVSRAGGLGMLGMGSAGTPEKLQTELAALADLQLPFGIGLVDWVVARQPALLTTALAARPALVSVSFGTDPSWIGRVHDAGAWAAVQVADVESARCAVDVGADVLVARGAEAGGHGTPAVGTLPLLTAVLDALEVPVLAAGGIAGGRGLAAVLAAGAAGAWIGTAFAACSESLTPEPARRVMLAAGESDTVLTRVFDLAHGYPWPPHLPERVIADGFTDRWTGRVEELAATAASGVNAGQGVGQLTAVRSAAEVVDHLARDARALLDRW
ncbi:2-nitropropane dioxygenase [Mycobacterium sp. djl-10]|nr:2-nitropropane dioxygenase [Mycobacterium sp. djl-10]